MASHYKRAPEPEESTGQQIIFELGICFAMPLAIGVVCELALRVS